MKICHVIRHSCIRVHKLAQAQRTQGDVEPYCYNSVFAKQHPHWQYEMVFRMFSFELEMLREQLLTQMKWIDKHVDAWHCHNTPDLFAPLVREVSKKPIFWDVHDLRSHQMQDDKYRYDEDAAARASNHIFTISPEYKDMLGKRYPDKDITYYRSMVPKEWMPKPSIAKRIGIVYEGGLSRRPGHYRNFLEYFERTTIPIHVYPSSDIESGEWMVPENVTFSQSTALFPLYREMTEFEAGIVGSVKHYAAFDGALPNKLWEYIACGIPVICANVKTVSEFIEHHKVGVTANSPEELPEALEKIRKDNYRANAVKLRESLSMDEQNLKFVLPIYRKYCV